MMPTTQQILAAMQLALREQVRPNVDDQWAQSALRSIDVILDHLQARAPVEGPILHADTGELLELFKFARHRLHSDMPALDGFLADAPALLAGYARVDVLQALNHHGRVLVDSLLIHCHERKLEPAAEEVHARLRTYLLRHAENESSYFFPVYVGRPI